MSDYTNTPIGSGYNTNASINTELSAVETAVNSKLDKSGSTMTGELDMNSKKILNLPDATTLQEPVTYGQMINGASFAAADAKYFDTVALATADTTLAVGDVVIIEERASGVFNVISGTGTANTYNIIAHDTLSLSLELRVEGETKTRHWGIGQVDASAGLNTLMTYLETNNVTVVSDSEEVFNTTTADIECKVGISWNANGATLKPVGFNGLLVGADSTGVSTTLSTDAQIQTATIVVSSSTGFSAGDLIELKSSALWPLDPTPTEDMRKGELAIIQSISGTTWSLQGLLYDNYDVSSETVTITRIQRITPKINNLNIEYATQEAKVGAELRGCVDGVFNYCSVKKAQTQGVNIAQSYNTVASNLNVLGSNGSGTGYGAQINDSTNCSILNSSFSECRRGVDISGQIPSRGCKVWHNHADGSGLDSAGSNLPSNTGSSGFGSHESSEHNSFRFNTITGVRNGFLLRGKDEVVSDNELRQDILLAIVQISNAINWTVNNNIYAASLRSGKTLDVVAADDDEQKASWFVNFTDPEIDGGFYRITNNKCDDLKNAFIRGTITTGAPFSSFSNFTITGNQGVMRGSASQTTVNFIEAGDQVFTITDSIILDNAILEDTAALTMYDTDITIDYANTVDVDNYPIPSTDIANGGGGGTITIDDSNLNLTVKNGVVTVTGFINFDITTATTIVKLQNLPTKTIGSIGPSYGFPYIGTVETGSVGNTGMIAMAGGTSGSIPTSAWISFDQLAYNTGFPVANNYHIPVSFQYATTRRLT